MKGIDTICGDAPSVWASYLINGDSSGLEESDIREADQFAKWLGGYIVDCTSEGDENHPGFIRWHDAAQFRDEFDGLTGKMPALDFSNAQRVIWSEYAE